MWFPFAVVDITAMTSAWCFLPRSFITRHSLRNAAFLGVRGSLLSLLKLTFDAISVTVLCRRTLDLQRAMPRFFTPPLDLMSWFTMLSPQAFHVTLTSTVVEMHL
ncbi:uncharacterized protein LOC120845402 [Ixodes scapularis]|uniref:uncharacterized protein LOC120845402 n=1 Tax=Ixodes scapularis TaxID=6945 RepID=UPI001A9D27E7|nr:uncharacterized protein LOC120845402 [Ixodes scapularis]